MTDIKDDIITGMEFQTDEMSSYLNKETGEVSTRDNAIKMLTKGTHSAN